MHTKNPPGGSAVAEPEELSPQWIYDVLMQEIEPDLTSANIKTLDERYAGESAGDKQARYERYEYAFILLDECLEDLKVDMHFDALELKQAMTAMAADESRTSDRKTMEDVEEQIDADPSA